MIELRQRISRHVQRQLLSRVGSLAAMGGRLAPLEQRIQALEDGARALESQLAQATERVRFTSRTTIARALALHPGARDVLAQHQLPHCDSCPVRHDETLEEAAAGHAIPLESLLSRLRALRSLSPEG